MHDIESEEANLIAVDALDSEEASEDSSIYHGTSALDENDGSVLLGVGFT